MVGAEGEEEVQEGDKLALRVEEEADEEVVLETGFNEALESHLNMVCEQKGTEKGKSGKKRKGGRARKGKAKKSGRGRRKWKRKRTGEILERL